LELWNALALRAFRKKVSAQQITVARDQLQEHARSGFFSIQPMPPGAYDRGRLLSRRYTRAMGQRALNILHVACAQLLKAEIFLTFDERQRRLASAERLRTK
jgi:predicted nucleic acid-binding protein